MRTDIIKTEIKTEMRGANRRAVLLGGATLSAAGLVALAGCATPAGAQTGARGTANAAQDAELLNAAIALEHEGIAAYDIALGSGLIPAGALTLVRTIQGHHNQHRDDLAAAVTRLGGAPAQSKTRAEYVTELNAGSIKSLEDIQRLALRLENGATNAYLGLISPLSDTDLHVLVARLAADEASHAAIFMMDLKEIYPVKAPLYG